MHCVARMTRGCDENPWHSSENPRLTRRSPCDYSSSLDDVPDITIAFFRITYLAKNLSSLQHTVLVRNAWTDRRR
jgi:hypothetical protein